MRSVALECRGVEVSYGTAKVLTDLDLEVPSGVAMAILGPSGSGKTTLLYTVAGFIQPTDGEVHIAGRLAGTRDYHQPPEQRNVGMVFQNYALWPHLTALETVAYPVRRAGAPAAEARQRAEELLQRLGIADLADRLPSELSGGQQQRVGLARALARNAALYLFDEPTAHLDAALRAAVQEEMAEQRRSIGASALYATHDAAEALAVADRVALLRDGRIVQEGTSADIYDQPVDMWSARLTGPASLLDAHVKEIDSSGVTLAFGSETVRVSGGQPHTADGPLRALARPDWVVLGGGLPGRVAQIWYRGPHTDYRLDTPAGLVYVRVPGSPTARIGEAVRWDLRRVWLVEDVEEAQT